MELVEYPGMSKEEPDELARELRRTLCRMEVAMGLLPDAVAWTDRAGLVRWCNAAFDRVVGLPHIAILGEDLARLLPLKEEHPAGRIARGERGGDARFDFRSRILAIRWESAVWDDDEVHVFLIRDLTEDHRTRSDLDKLRKAEERFRLAVEASPNAMVMVDRAGAIILVNTQSEKLFGYPREELLGKKIEILVPPRFREAHPGHRAGFHASPRARPMGAGRDLYGLRKDGTEIPVEIGLTPIEASEGLVLASVIDITERKRGEAQARESARLEAAQAELETFSYSVAHDLRAPLRHIDGFIGMLRKSLAGKADARGTELMDKISQSAKRLGALIDEFLAFSKTARTDLVKTPVALSALAAEVIEQFKPDLKGRKVTWKVGALPEAVCDAGMIKLVFFNLIGNALKFTRGRSPAVIEIAVAPGEPGETTICVGDNGVGFDMRFADKLFGVFQRLHRMEDFEGTGIGLANVRRIIAKHGGRTWAKGEVDKGAAFYFSLPAPEKQGAP